jgi:hypothetical protein
MNKRTTELISIALGVSGSENQVHKEIKKKFATGEDILKECEAYEQLIKDEGEEAFMARVRRIVAARGSNAGTEKVPGGEAEDNSSSGSDSET